MYSPNIIRKTLSNFPVTSPAASIISAVLYGYLSGAAAGGAVGDGERAEQQRRVEPAAESGARRPSGKSCAKSRGSAYGYDDSGQTISSAPPRARSADALLVQAQQARELRGIPLFEDADVGLHQPGADLGRGGPARVGLVHAHRAVAEVGDQQRAGHAPARARRDGAANADRPARR